MAYSVETLKSWRRDAKSKRKTNKAAETLLENRMITVGKWMITTPRLKRK